MNEYCDITNNKKDRIVCSDFVQFVNTLITEKSSALKIKKDMAFNGFEQHKIGGVMYYCGLVDKTYAKTKDNKNDFFLDD